MTLSAGKVLVLMSGGVDSSTAAALLLCQGYEITGATLLLRDGGGTDSMKRQIEDARLAADRLGIDHTVIDIREQFRKLVVEPFVETYAGGRTPNPCVMCNPLVKFGTVMPYADEHGYDYIATGHYARTGQGPDGRRYIMKGADPSRDQSYFLYRLSEEMIARARFPLGGATKEKARTVARELKLPTAYKEDSQEICFIPSGDLNAFLKENIPTGSISPGAIKMIDGSLLGRHQGIHCYTVGQRRGLNVAAGRPLYVISIDPEEGTLVVGDDRELYASSFKATDLHWSISPPLDDPLRARVRIRYKHREAPALIHAADDGVRVVFDQPQRAIAPGQSAVFYQEDRVLGGGIIDGLS